MKPLLAAFLALASLSMQGARPASQTFTGTISDEMCALEGHSIMRMGPTDADCVVACVQSHGAQYVLVSGRSVYVLSDQVTPEKFAGQQVTVVGALDEKTKRITVQSIAAKPEQKTAPKPAPKSAARPTAPAKK